MASAAPPEGALLLVAAQGVARDGGGAAPQPIALPASELPRREVEAVLDLLASEAAPVLSWLDCAKTYLAAGNSAAFLEIVREASTEDVLLGWQSVLGRDATFERVVLLCSMAAFHMEAARAAAAAAAAGGGGAAAVAAANAARVEAIAAADRCVAEAERLQSREMLPHVARAQLALLKGDANQALLELRRADKLTHNGARNHAPLVGQAALHYAAGRLQDAMRCYKTVLTENPNCPAEVRAAIGACYYRAGRVDAAAAAYTRALELDGGCADALLGLAVIKFGSRDAQEGLNAGLQLLARAYAADPSHPGVLCALSHFKLLQGEAAQARALAAAALDAADGDALRAAAWGLLGRCHHALDELPAAQAAYTQATRLDAKAPLPHLGMAQVYLAAGTDPTNAVSELELVLAALPGNPDALHLLGGLLPKLPDRVGRALKEHREAAARQTGNAALQQTLGELLASTEPAAALAAFETALAVHRKQQQQAAARNAQRAAQRQQVLLTANGGGGGDGQQQQQPPDALASALLADVGDDEPVPAVPARLLNNTAVLKYRAGDVAAAAELMAEAEGAVASDADVTPVQKITMGYNMARLQEATGNLKAASSTYQALLQTVPGYVDCYLRLSAMAKAVGDAAAAEQWALAATKQAGGHVDANAMLASLHLSRRDLQAARSCVAAADAGAGAGQRNNDAYMKLTHANVVLAALPADRASRVTAPPKQLAKNVDVVTHALRMFRDVLQQNPDNIYAANGVGTCLAELGHTAAAKACFDEVVRATARTKGFVKLPEVYINLGNLWLGRQAYDDALRMYAHASRLCNHKNAEVLLYMARAHYDAGDAPAARRVLLRVLHLDPANHKARFDLALALQDGALKAFHASKPAGGSAAAGGGSSSKSQAAAAAIDAAAGDVAAAAAKKARYEAAAGAFASAARVFAHLEALGKGVTRMDERRLRMHAEYCATQLPKARAAVAAAAEEALRAEAEAARRQAEMAAAELARRQHEAAEAASKRAEAARKRAEAERVLHESQRRLDERRAARDAPLADDDGGGANAAAAGGGRAAGKKRGRGRKAGAAGADAEADADEAFYVDDDVPIERLPKRKAADDAEGALKRAGLASDDDDDGDDDDEDVKALFGSGGGSDAGEGHEAGGGGGKDAEQQEQQQQQATPASAGGRGRLKKRREEAAAAAAADADAAGAGADAAAAAEFEDADADDGENAAAAQRQASDAEQALEDDLGAAAIGVDADGDGNDLDEALADGDGEQQQQQSARKRGRQQALASDDEEDDEGGGGGPAAAAAATAPAAEPEAEAAAEGAAEGAAAAGAAAAGAEPMDEDNVDALFGDDDG